MPERWQQAPPVNAPRWQSAPASSQFVGPVPTEQELADSRQMTKTEQVMRRLGLTKDQYAAEYQPESAQYQERYGATRSGKPREPFPTFQGGTQQEYQQFLEQVKNYNTPLLSTRGELSDFAAGMGKQVTDMGLGAQQIVGAASYEDATKKRELDAPLMATGAGRGGQFAGGVMAAAPAAFIPGVNTVVGGTLLGGALGAVQPTEKPWERTINTATGAAIGGVTNYVGNRIARGAAPPNRAPSIEELEAAKNAAYQIAENSNEVVTQTSLAPVIPKVENVLRSRGYRPGNHPAAKESLDALYEDLTQPGIYGQTFRGVEGLRRQLLGSVRAARNREDAAMAQAVLDEFDDVFDAAAPALSEKAHTARELFHRLRKAEDIQLLFEKATNAAQGQNQAGFDNTLRLQFKSLADNQKRFNRFSPEERAAILKVVRGGPVQSLVRFFGRFATRGPVSAMATGIIGNAIGGPSGAVALGALGEGSRAVAGGMRTGAANNVSELVRRGASAPLVGNGAIAQTGLLPPVAIGTANALAFRPPANALNERERRNALAR